VSDLKPVTDPGLGIYAWEYHVGLLWKGRYRIALIAFLAVVAGVVYSFMLPPVFKTDAVIQPKSSNPQGILTLGGLGGEVSSQLSRLEVVLSSRDLAADLLQRHPALTKRIFPEKVNKETGAWKKGKPPTFLEKTGRLRTLIEVSSNIRKNLLTLSVETHDPALSKRIAEAYLESLNLRMRDMVTMDADSNQTYLVHQLTETQDPILRERILNLMGAQLERSMQINARSFEVIERPVLLDKKTGPSRRRMVAIALLMGILLGVFTLYLGQALAYGRVRLKRLADG
jgi:uncharacterized protein involved in exopolysaccharide biosynthesis